MLSHLANEEIDPSVDHFVLSECDAMSFVAIAVRDFSKSLDTPGTWLALGAQRQNVNFNLLSSACPARAELIHPLTDGKGIRDSNLAV